MIKTKLIRGILIVSVLAVLILPVYTVFVLYPSFTGLLLVNTEKEAERIAGHAASMINSKKMLVDINSLSPDLLNLINKLKEDFNLTKIKVYSASGEVIYSTDSRDIGTVNTQSYFQNVVAKGNKFLHIVKKNTTTLEGQLTTIDVVESYVPITSGETFMGAFEIYYDISARKEAFSSLVARLSTLVFLIASGLLAAIVFMSVKARRTIVEHNRTEEELNRYREHLEDLVKERTNEISVANQLLEREISERTEAQDALAERAKIGILGSEIGFALTTSTSLNEMLSRCAEALVAHLEAAFARIWLLNEQEKVLELAASAGMYRNTTGLYSRIPLGLYKVGLIALERKPLLTNKVQTDPFIRDKEWAKREGIVAFAGHPLVVEGRLIGVMAIFSRRQLSDVAAKTLESSADVLAVGIDRKRAEDMLRKSEEKYKNLVELGTDMIYISDAEGNQTFLNDAAFRKLEITPDEIIGKPWIRLIHPDDVERSYRKFREMINKGIDVFDFENRFVSRSGRIIHVMHNVRVLRNEQGEIVGTQGIARDISDRKKLEDEILKSKKIESIGTLAGGIAHDFNNLLTAILGNISLAGMQAELGSDLAKILSNAENASLRARDLTQQFITFSKGGLPLKEVAVLDGMIRDAADFALSGSSVDIEYHFPDSLWPAEVDRGQISQVIHNLVLNAREAMPGGGTITMRGENALVEEGSALLLEAGHYVKISVHDQGIGISDQNIAKIFDPYFTTKEIGSEKGMGLGLAICFSIIKNHHGVITVESEVGRGTTFIVYLPAVPRQKGRVKADAASAPPELAGEGRILLMDDDEMLRRVSRSMLETLGYEVALAENGFEAIDLFRKAIKSQNPFDAVILDLTVRGSMGGMQTITKLREIDPHIRSLISSGYTKDPVLTDFGSYGFNGVIIKPYDIQQLGAALKNIIKKKSS